MFKSADEFSAAVLARRKMQVDDTLLEIMVAMQDEYGIEEKDIVKLVTPFLKDCIMVESTNANLIKIEEESL